MGEFAKSVEEGGEAVEADFSFHQAVAGATKNVNFAAFLNFIGGQIIPRRNIQIEIANQSARREYLLGVLAVPGVIRPLQHLNSGLVQMGIGSVFL